MVSGVRVAVALMLLLVAACGGGVTQDGVASGQSPSALPDQSGTSSTEPPVDAAADADAGADAGAEEELQLAYVPAPDSAVAAVRDALVRRLGRLGEDTGLADLADTSSYEIVPQPCGPDGADVAIAVRRTVVVPDAGAALQAVIDALPASAITERAAEGVAASLPEGAVGAASVGADRLMVSGITGCLPR